MSHAWMNSMVLANKVKSGEFKPSYYRSKNIIERGKPRTIKPPKFECKVVQKVLCDYLLRSLLSPKMISTSYASMRGKGVDKMFKDILQALNHADSQSVIVITDYSGYFASINTDLICRMFFNWGVDDRVVALFHSFDPDGIGLSLGNEVSQIPASWFVSSVDHALKDKHQFKNVFRFMDDTLVITENNVRAKACLNIIQEESNKIGLKIKNEKVHVFQWGHEFKFCKGNFYFNKSDNVYYWIMNQATIRNEIRKLGKFKEKYQNGEMSRNEITHQVNGVVGSILSKPNTFDVTQKILKKYDKIFRQ